ncbi:hypothetical protein IKW75_00100 [Candidatus Saccharibacteria bacterium]|nr:hypothetical protein [Candidatus Saccharibacteria bacterium]
MKKGNNGRFFGGIFVGAIAGLMAGHMITASICTSEIELQKKQWETNATPISKQAENSKVSLENEAVIADDTYIDDKTHTVHYDDRIDIITVANKDRDYVASKLTTIDPDYEWTNVEQDLSLDAQVPYRKESFAADVLNISKGEVIYSTDPGVYPQVTIAVPEITSSGASISKLSNYGTVLVTIISQDECDDTGRFYAESELHIYNKNLVGAGHPLTFAINEKRGEVYLTGPTDGSVRLRIDSLERWKEADADPLEYTEDGLRADLDAFYWGGSYKPSGNIRFTKTSVKLDNVSVYAIVDAVSSTDLKTRKDHDDLYSNSGRTFDLLGLINSESGAVMGKEIVRVSNDMYYIIGNDPLDAFVITIQPTKITVGVCATTTMDLSTSRIYNGLYFEDKTPNPKTVSTKDTNLTLTRATLENLIYLLEDSGTAWHKINAKNLGLTK